MWCFVRRHCESCLQGEAISFKPYETMYFKSFKKRLPRQPFGLPRNDGNFIFGVFVTYEAPLGAVVISLQSPHPLGAGLGGGIITHFQSVYNVQTML
jgi:hypothetical protein